MGRPLKKDRLHAIENVLPVVAISEDKITDARNLDPASLFVKPFSDYWFEIGFGNGEHLIALKNIALTKILPICLLGFLVAQP